MLTPAGIEAAQAPLIGHHQLTVGLLLQPVETRRRGFLSPARKLPEGTYPLFSYTDVGGPCGHAIPRRPERRGESPGARATAPT